MQTASQAFDWAAAVRAVFDSFPSVACETAAVGGRLPDPDSAEATVRESFDDPVGSAPLAERLGEARRIAIVVPDARDSVGTEPVRALLQHLDAFARQGAEIVGVVASRAGAALAHDGENTVAHVDALRCYGHRVVANAAATWGGGEEPALCAELEQADLIVALSRLRLRIDAGFSGGLAQVAVGGGSAASWAAWEHRLLELGLGAAATRPRVHPAQRTWADSPLRERVFGVVEAATGASRAWVSGDALHALDALATRPDAGLRTRAEPSAGAVVVVEGGEGATLECALESYLLLVGQDHPPVEPGAPVLLVARCGRGVAAGALGPALTAALREGPLDAPPAADAAPEVVGAHRLATRLRAATTRNPLIIAAPGLPRIATHGLQQSTTIGDGVARMKRILTTHGLDGTIALLRDVTSRLPSAHASATLGPTPSFRA
jgi:hypothetical protein